MVGVQGLPTAQAGSVAGRPHRLPAKALLDPCNLRRAKSEAFIARSVDRVQEPKTVDTYHTREAGFRRT